MFQNNSPLTCPHHALPSPHSFPIYASLASKEENLVLQKPVLNGKTAVCLLLSHSNNYCQELNNSCFLAGGKMLLIAGTLRDLILLANEVLNYLWKT